MCARIYNFNKTIAPVPGDVKRKKTIFSAFFDKTCRPNDLRQRGIVSPLSGSASGVPPGTRVKIIIFPGKSGNKV